MKGGVLSLARVRDARGNLMIWVKGMCCLLGLIGTDLRFGRDRYNPR